MFTAFLGHYLLNKGLVTASGLQTALEQMQQTHVKLGVLSVNARYMTAVQADEVHKRQMQTDQRFGEIAVAMGYMTEEQLQSLLASQKEGHLQLGQALIDQGTLTLEKFSDALQQFKAEHYLSDEQFEAAQKGDIDILVEALLKLEPAMDSHSYRSYLTLFVKNVIRFVEPQIFLEINRIPEGYECDWLITQEVTGPEPLYTGIAMDTEAFLKVASRFAEEVIEEPGELAAASVGEFLNLHNGLFLVNMSQQGLELGLEPQQVIQKALLPTSWVSQYLVTVYLPEHSFQLIVSKSPG